MIVRVGRTVALAADLGVNYQRVYNACRRLGIADGRTGAGRPIVLSPAEEDAVRLTIAMNDAARAANVGCHGGDSGPVGSRRSLMDCAARAALDARGRRWILATPKHGSSHATADALVATWIRLGRPVAHVANLDRLRSAATELLSVAGGR